MTACPVFGNRHLFNRFLAAGNYACEAFPLDKIRDIQSCQITQCREYIQKFHGMIVNGRLVSRNIENERNAGRLFKNRMFAPLVMVSQMITMISENNYYSIFIQVLFLQFFHKLAHLGINIGNACIVTVQQLTLQWWIQDIITQKGIVIGPFVRDVHILLRLRLEVSIIRAACSRPLKQGQVK